MTKTLSMASHKIYNLNANEGFVIFCDFQVDYMVFLRFHFENEIPVNCLSLNGSEHIYWIMDLKNEVHLIWDLWISGLRECKGNGLFKNGWDGQNYSVGSRKCQFPKKLVGGGLTSAPR